MGKFGLKLAIAGLAAVMGGSATAAGYSVRALAPTTASLPSYSHLLGAAGQAVGETFVRRSCPIRQWVGCMMDGHTDRQPRAVLWSPFAQRPFQLQCLDATLAPHATWDKPCEPLGLNSKGALVGRSYVGSDAAGAQRPVYWPTATSPAIDLSPKLQGLPAYDSARAVGINDAGWILGRARLSGSNSEYAFLLRDGLSTALPNAGAMAVMPVAINNTMAIGEGRYDTGGRSGVIIWTLGGGTMALRSIGGADDHVYASGLSAAGHVTGAYWSPQAGSNTQAYLWHQGRVHPLATDPGHDSRGHSVNAAGEVVGTHCATGQDIRGCRATVWTHGVRRDLNELTSPPAGFTFVDARAINDQGQITGWMVDTQGLFRGFLLTPRP